MLLGRLLRRSLNQFLIAASLALPKRKHRVRIAGVLVNGAVRRNDLSATTRTCPTARSSLFDVDIQQLALVFHDDARPLPQAVLTNSCPVAAPTSRGSDIIRTCDDETPK